MMSVQAAHILDFIYIKCSDLVNKKHTGEKQIIRCSAFHIFSAINGLDSQWKKDNFRLICRELTLA